MAYDPFGQWQKFYRPNETTPSKVTRRIRYQSTSAPGGALDSLKQDTLWLVSLAYHDGYGRIIQKKNIVSSENKSIVQNISCNAVGNQDSLCNPYTISGASYTYSSPAWNGLTTTKFIGLTKTIMKNALGDSIITVRFANTDTMWDGKGNKTARVYNAFGTVDTVIEPLNIRTKYVYDRLGHLTKITDAEGKESYCYYDTLGRLRGVNNPDASSDWQYHGLAVDVYYEYDDLGNLQTMKNGQGTMYYTYDEINRLTKIEFYNGSVTIEKARFSYDAAYSPPSPDSLYNNPKGRLGKVVTCGIDSTLYYYSDAGNLSRKNVTIDGLGLKYFIYRYNNAGLCTLFYGGNADTVRYRYNHLGRLYKIPNIVNSIKYNPAGGAVKINYANPTIDTIGYDSLFRPLKIRTELTGGGGDIYQNLIYAYEKNSNVASIIDSANTNWNQNFTYDSLNRLIDVDCSEGEQAFTYDKVGNRLTKNGNEYTYVSGTNRLDNVGLGWTYRYDNCGNVIRRNNWFVTDTFIYNWHNRLTQFTRGSDNVEFTYDISGLRVKKHYYTTGDGGGGESGSMGIGFGDPISDMGIKSKTADSVYNKGRDIGKIWVKRTAHNYEFTIVNKHLFNVQNQTKLFITLDLDTITNSGRITLPEDSLTRVPKKAAWEYCLFIGDNEYGYYTQNGTKHASPMGMLVNKTFGDSGQIKITVSKQLLNSVPAIRVTLSTFAPGLTNNNPLIQGGSSAADVWPGTKKTFGGDINGYGQITPNSVTLYGEYTIYYIYDGIDPIVEYTADGSILSCYIYANGRHVAEINGEDTSWYHCDALGSTRKMTNRMGANIWHATYYPFGEMTGDGGNEHSFTGKEWDTEMSLNYFCQRYYDPDIGRFMEMDPALDPAVSSYIYCNNNPPIYTDPTGEKNQIGKYETHAWASMNYNKSNILDPDFWEPGWEKTYWDKIHETEALIARSEWAKTVEGAAILKQLRLLIANGCVFIGPHPGVPTAQEAFANCIYSRTKEGDIVLVGIQIGTFLLNTYSTEYIALALVHESAHAFHFEKIGLGGDAFETKCIREANAALFEYSFYSTQRTMFTELESADAIGLFSSVPFIGGWYLSIKGSYTPWEWAYQLGRRYIMW
jgi:RHS repeat-associated protein